MPHTNPRSRGRIARWVLEEVGRPYRVEVVGYGDAMRSPAFLALNPMGKVPVLRHGSVVVTEAAAIAAYLADAFSEAGLAPAPGHPARGPYHRWLFFGAGPLEAAVTNVALGVTPSDAQRAMVGYGNLSAVLDTLEGVVSGTDYLADGRFSAADLYVGAQLGWGMLFGTIEKRPAFQRYWERVSDRPAAKRAAAMDGPMEGG